MNFNWPSHKRRLPKSLSSFLPLQATKEKANTLLPPKTKLPATEKFQQALSDKAGQRANSKRQWLQPSLQRSSEQPDSTGPETPPAAHPAGLPTSEAQVRSITLSMWTKPKSKPSGRTPLPYLQSVAGHWHSLRDKPTAISQMQQLVFPQSLPPLTRLSPTFSTCTRVPGSQGPRLSLLYPCIA